MAKYIETPNIDKMIIRLLTNTFKTFLILFIWVYIPGKRGNLPILVNFEYIPQPFFIQWPTTGIGIKNDF
jgi:hypothetical protein